MKIIKKLIFMYKFLFLATMLFTFLSIGFNLYWNRFLADTINMLGNLSSTLLLKHFTEAVVIILLYSAIESVSSYLASYTCEIFAHEMRMGYARFYLQADLQTLSRLNVGKEQSAMQNELREVSAYLQGNLFSFIKQLITFSATVIFLLYQNFTLTLLSTLPVVPLILYCAISSKVIKNLTDRCQNSKKHINGMIDTLLDLFPIIQIYNAQSLISATMDEHLLKWQNSNIKQERITARLMSLSGLLSFIPLLLLLGFGGTMVVKGKVSLGIFYIFINLSGNVSGFLQNMPNIYAGFRQFDAAACRLEKKLILNPLERRKYGTIHGLFR